MNDGTTGGGPETQKVSFFFTNAGEQALLDELKRAGLIPEHIQSFSELGPEAIGVIENAVETGVLTLDGGGMLKPGDGTVSQEDARAGAKIKPSPFGDGEPPVDSFTVGDITVYKHSSGGFFVQEGDAPPTWIPPEQFNAASFTDGDKSVTAEDVADAFANGDLEYENGVVAVGTVTAINGDQLTLLDSTTFTDPSGEERKMIQTDSGFYVEGNDGKFVHVNTPAYNAVGLDVNGTNVESVAEKFKTGELALDPKGNVVAPGVTANTYDAGGAMTGTVVKSDRGYHFYPAGQTGGIHIDTPAFQAAGFTDSNWGVYNVWDIADKFTAGALKNNNGVIEFVPPSAP